jgi:hypothetical protein
MSTTRWLQVSAWSLSLGVTILAFITWGRDNAWQFQHLSPYQLFPVLGLIAFSLMWSHYVMGTVRELLGAKEAVLKRYFQWTGYAVLALICLHPGLLIYQLYRDGVGLPPGSYESYAAHGLGWITLLGTASLFIFLAFELHRVFGERSWWRYVVDASDAAMLGILYHGFRLGSQLQQGWYRYVWLVYTVTFVAVLVRKYSRRLTHQKSPV